jgi:hypothetical protein
MSLPASSVLLAQNVNIAPAAPLPSQILTAKKIFITNIGEKYSIGVWSGGPARMYNELYAAIKSCGFYELVTAPANSDLVMEVKVITDQVQWQMELVLLDPKTQTPLWTIYEPINVSGMQKTRDKNFNSTIAKLVDDLKALTAQPAASK